MGVGARHGDFAGLERRAQGIQRLRAELRQLIQEQHPVVSQGHLARLGPHAAAGQRGHGGGMVRTAERARAGQRPLGDHPGQRPDHGGLQQFGRRQGRQQAGQTLGQHRLARARRAHEQQVVPACRRHLERPLGLLLALHVAQIGRIDAGYGGPRFRPSHHLGPAEMIDHRDQGPGRENLEVAGPGRLPAVGFRADEAEPHRGRRHRSRQRARHRRDLSVETQFTHGHPAIERVDRKHAHGSQQRQGDRQVEVAALLGQVSRGEVGHHALGRKGQADPGQGAAHPLTALGHGLVAQADDLETALLAVGRGDLHVDPPGLHPLERDRHDLGEHRFLRWRTNDELKPLAIDRRL